MDRQSILELIKKSEILVPSGASCEGNSQQRIRSLLNFGGRKDLAKMIYGILPGDNTMVGGDEKTVSVSLASPIAYDLWYLFHTTNALPSTVGGDALQEEVLGGMSTLLDGLQGIKPLRTLRNAGNLGIGLSPAEAKSHFVNDGIYLIKEMRFEQIPKGSSFKHPSDGNEANHVAFLAFPVGQFGVMENQSLVSESMIERDALGDTTEVISGGDFMPPIKKDRNACPGNHIIDTAYLATSDKVEYIAKDFEGQENFPPHMWERYWISEKDTWPVPGEFVGLVCRSLPWHAWWFQETFPFLYSGNWFDTGHYTSGVITEIIEDADDEETDIYKVLVRGLELCLRPSDFCGYEVEDRVAVLKKDGDTSNFDWTKLDTWTEFEQKKATGSVVSCDDWVVVPITFYESGV